MLFQIKTLILHVYKLIHLQLSEACQNKVWVACTAQQDLSEIMDDCNIAEEKDKEGKIKGRFEVKGSLKGTQPEVASSVRGWQPVQLCTQLIRVIENGDSVMVIK